MAKTNPTTDNYSRILSDLRGGTYKPIYVLMGEEAYFIDQISNYIAQNALPPSEQEFNLITLYGENVTAKEVDVAARRYPMMSERQVIIVREAQQIRRLEDLENYAKTPVPSTVLVLCVKGKFIDKRTAFYRALLKVGEVFESELFKSYDATIGDWIAGYLKTQQCTIDRAATAILVEALGVELSKITSELDRLRMMLPPNTTKITAEDVEKLGVSKDYNNFELCNALMQKDIYKTQMIVNYFEKTPKSFDLQSTLGAIFSQFTKLFAYLMLCKKYKSPASIPEIDLQEVIGLHPFIIKKDYAPAAAKFSPAKARSVIDAIRYCDMRSKGWGGATTQSGDLLKELVYLILH
jgi:DNA polymerase-3 subunit delta